MGGCQEFFFLPLQPVNTLGIAVQRLTYRQKHFSQSRCIAGGCKQIAERTEAFDGCCVPLALKAVLNQRIHDGF